MLRPGLWANPCSARSSSCLLKAVGARRSAAFDLKTMKSRKNRAPPGHFAKRLQLSRQRANTAPAVDLIEFNHTHVPLARTLIAGLSGLQAQHAGRGLIDPVRDFPAGHCRTNPILSGRYRRDDARPHSALMLAARITLPHFSVSSAMSFPKSAGEPASATPPKSAG